GILAEELPRLFERFHRIRSVRGRALEGTGIGLALVQELVRLHGGSIRVESVWGRGSTFIVSVPLARAPSPAGPDPAPAAPPSPPAALGAGLFLTEATRWLPDPSQIDAAVAGRFWGQEASARCEGPGDDQEVGDRPRVLVADDNADMRRYLGRLL